MKHSYYSKTEERVMQELAAFQYLTSSQFVRLGLTKTRKGIYPVLKKLSEGVRPEIGKINYTVSPTHGRPESVYFLTARGAKHLVDHHGAQDTDIKRPKRSSVSFASDYYHRIWTVDFFIGLKLWCIEEGYQLRFFSYYFQQSSGSNRNNKGGKSLADNRIDVESGGIGYIVPDGVFIVDRPDQKPLFGLFEQHNGKDTAKFLRQVYAHTQAMLEGAPSLHYDAQHEGAYVGNRVYCQFEHESCKQAVLQRLARSEDFKPFEGRFEFL